MKLDIIDESNYIVYCIDKKNLDVNNQSNIKLILKDVFMYIKNNYNEDVSGNYDVRIYMDNFNNYVIEINSNFEELLYRNNRLDINININKDVPILYEVEDYFLLHKFKYKHNIYYYNNKYYLLLNKDVSNKLYMYLLEVTSIVYKNTNLITKNYNKILI